MMIKEEKFNLKSDFHFALKENRNIILKLVSGNYYELSYDFEESEKAIRFNTVIQQGIVKEVTVFKEDIESIETYRS